MYGDKTNKTDYCIQHVMHDAIHMAKLSLNFKGLINASRTLGIFHIKMQRNFYIPKSRN